MKSEVFLVGLLVFASLFSVFASHGEKLQDTNSIDSNGSPSVSEELYKNAFSFVPYIEIFTNFTLTDMKNWIDDIMDWQEPTEFKQKFPYYIAGYDFEDRPILIIEFGKYKVQEVIEQGPKAVEDLEKYIQKAAVNVLMSMTHQNSSRKDAKEISAILDIDGFQYGQGIHAPTITFARKITARYGPLLNQAVNKVVIINANYIGDVGFQLVRPLLGQLLERVDLYGTKKSKWIPMLRRAFPAESLPPWYGGSRDFKAVRVFG